MGERILRDMTTKEVVGGVNIPKLSQLRFSEGCVEGKMNRKPFYPVKELRSTRRLERIHSSYSSSPSFSFNCSLISFTSCLHGAHTSFFKH